MGKGSLLIIILLVSLNGNASGAPTTSATQAATASLSFSCLDWQPVGMCFWLKCYAWYCRVRTSVKIRHYVPDLMVQVYSNTDEAPIKEAQSILGSILSQVGATNNYEKSAANYTAKKQKSADAFGHPLSSFFSSSGPQMGYLCNGSAKSLYPYFTSALDFVAWRLSIPEFAYPESFNLNDILRSNGTGEAWGNLYPRDGSIIQPDTYKASAIFAQRVGDIVTRSSQPHVYKELKASRRDGWWPPGKLNPQDENTGKWQMILPKISKDCAVFPNDEPITEDDRSEHGNYVWNLWRPYKCCQRKGQIFLYDVEWGK